MSSPISIVPGVSVGRFVLGAPLREVVQIAKSTLRGVVRVRLAQLDPPSTSDDTVPIVKAPLHIRSDRDGLTLMFHPIEQRLEAVMLTDLRSCELHYHGTKLCGPLTPPTFQRVYDVLGPTFSGKLQPESNQYVLSYPGLHISFPVPPPYHSYFQSEQLLTKLPNGFVPIAESMVITTTGDEDTSSARTAVVPTVSAPHAHLGVHLIPGVGAVFQNGSGLRIPFRSTTPQSLVSVLGPPATVFNKFDRRLAIHNPELREQSRDAVAYHMAYPHLGLDFTFSGLNYLTKITAWSPRPMHESFLHYHTCWYRVPLPTPYWEVGEAVVATSTMSDLESRAQRRLPPSLLSSSGCANGLVMRIVALDGVVLYAMPSGEILRVMVLADTYVDTTRWPVERWPATEEVDRSPVLPISLPDLPKATPALPPVASSTGSADGCLWDDDDLDEEVRPPLQIPAVEQGEDQTVSPMQREGTVAAQASTVSGDGEGCFYYDPAAAWSEEEEEEEVIHTQEQERMQQEQTSSSSLHQDDADGDEAALEESDHEPSNSLSVPPPLETLRQGPPSSRHTDPNVSHTAADDGAPMSLSPPLDANYVSNESHYSEDFETMTGQSEDPNQHHAAMQTAGNSQYSAVSSARGDSAATPESPLAAGAAVSSGELLGSWWPDRQASSSSAAAPIDSSEQPVQEDDEDDENDDDGQSSEVPSPTPPPSSGGKSPSPSQGRKPSPPPQPSKKNKKKKGRR